MKFSCLQEKNGNATTLKLSGQFDEHATLPAVDPKEFALVKMDFDKVNSINSVGVRTWIKWVGDKVGKTKIIYVNCPKIIVDQLNMVVALANSGQVDSFYTPYFCETSSTSHQILFRRGHEYDEKSLRPPKQVKCPEGDGMAEMDVIEKTYFKFLGI